MIASLPMYDRPETAPIIDQLWSEIRTRLGGDAPAHLTRGASLWDQWGSPDLVLSQTCGYPYRARLRDRVQLVATPDNRLPGCPPGHYNSVFVCRADDPRMTLAEFAEAPFAFSEPLSQSGWGAPQNHAADLGFAFSNDIYTSAHVQSARAVTEGRADIACIDALSLRLILRHDPHASALREIARTRPTPAPPFITGPGQDAGVIRAALAGAIDALTPEAQDTIGLFGLADVPEADYLGVPNPAPPSDPLSRV